MASIALGLTACGIPEQPAKSSRYADRTPSADEAKRDETQVPATDSGERFVVSSEEKKRLVRSASEGERDAAFRLWQHYAIAGGDSGRTGDPANAVEARRWLQKAAELGHQTAQFNLAVDILDEDCEAGRRLLREIAAKSDSPEMRENAKGWLATPCGKA